jgi:hypothetical protein
MDANFYNNVGLGDIESTLHLRRSKWGRLRVECNMESFTYSSPKSSWASLRDFCLWRRFHFNIYTSKNNASSSKVIWNCFGAKPYSLHSVFYNNLLIVARCYGKKTIKCFRPSKTIQSSSLDLPKPLWSKLRSSHGCLVRMMFPQSVLKVCGYQLALLICSWVESKAYWIQFTFSPFHCVSQPCRKMPK